MRLSFSQHSVSPQHRTVILAFGAVLAVVAVYLLGFWLELLWYSATDSTDRFWQFGPARLGFVVAGALLAMLLSWPFLNLAIVSPTTSTAKILAFGLVALCGAITGLGLWELLSMLAQNCQGVEFLHLVSLCTRWNGGP